MENKKVTNFENCPCLTPFISETVRVTKNLFAYYRKVFLLGTEWKKRINIGQKMNIPHAKIWKSHFYPFLATNSETVGVGYPIFIPNFILYQESLC